MSVHIRVERSERENNMGVLRRFRSRVMDWGGPKRLRSIRYATRAESTFVKRKNRLRAIKRKAEGERSYKLGLTDRT
ncbi:MAG TPA: hypothetical protein VJ837_00600 [Candidatus Paceibacterota bacterium]|jgi:hypothetical protein|nr:hypothetical protein [Candidatus Paceibacterota bacterium]